MIAFVTSSAQALIGDVAAVFPVSARLAQAQGRPTRQMGRQPLRAAGKLYSGRRWTTKAASV